MQPHEVEVSFCDLCGTSVPAADLAGGSAVRHQGKTIGGCCMPALRGNVPAPTAGAGIAASPVRAAGGEIRVLPIAIALLAAIAAATIFLDHRTTASDDEQRRNVATLIDAQASDSQVLLGLAAAMDTVPRRTDLDALVGKFAELGAAANAARDAQQRQLEALGGAVAALAQEQRAQAAKAVDYGPLFEDMRQRQVRLVDLVSTLRAVAPVAEPATPAPAPATPPENTGPTLSPALAEHVKKLQATEAAVRFEAVDELLRSKDVLVLPHLLPLARDPDAFVRRLTVEGLAAWKRPEVVDALLGALGDADEYVRDTSWRSLRDVTGQKLPFEAAASQDARSRAAQKWRDWWEKNKATFGS
jgi:hypothetical protein